MDYRKLLLKIAENWPVKILSIALAIVLYVFHQNNTMKTRGFPVPLHVEIDGNYTISSPYDRTVRVNMHGETDSILPLGENDVEVYIDLKGKSKGTYHAPVLVRKKGAAVGVDPLEITTDPAEISITIDNKVSKYVPLIVNTTGNLAGGFQLISSTLTPPEVAIDGPADVIDTIAELSTDSIVLDERSQDFSVVVNILNHEPLISIRGNGTAEYRGYVQEIITQKTFSDVPIVITGLDDAHLRAELDAVGMVTFSGKSGDMEAYTASYYGTQSTASKAILNVDCSSIKEIGSYTLPVAIKVPASLELVERSPETVTVKVVQIDVSENSENTEE